MKHPLRVNRLAAVTLLSLGLASFGQAASPVSARAASDETIGDTFPVSVTPQGAYANGEGTADYGPVSISDDGRYVAFESSATNLGAQGPAGANEGFVKDLDTGEVELVSRANGASGEPAGEPGVENLELSGNGDFVIFTSRAPNLVSGLPAEEPEEQHVYRRDLLTGETTLVDRVTGAAGAILSRDAVAEAISDNGRYVVFAADVDDLEDPAGAHANTGIETVYVRDMQTDTTTAVSRAAGATGAIANEASQAYSISADGSHVAFVSRATNLLPGTESNIYPQVYLRDLQTDTTTLVSHTASGEAGEGRSENPVLVGEDGCQVEFSSEVDNLLEPPSIEIHGEPVDISGPQIYLADLCSIPATMTILSQDETGIAGDAYGVFGGSADGNNVLFAGEFLSGYHLFLRDLSTGQTAQLDRSSGAEGESANRESEQASISANGCRAVFDTNATNLGSPEGPNGERPAEVYVRQLGSCQPPAEEEHHEETEEAGNGGEQPNTGGQPTNTGEQANGGGQGPTTAAAATPVQPPAAVSSAAPACVVPTMRALDLRAVEQQLSAAHCALGRVTYHYSAIPKGGLVEQSLHQGTIRAAGTRVDVWLSRGRHLHYDHHSQVRNRRWR